MSITFSIGGVPICERLHQVPAILAQASNACTTAQAEGGKPHGAMTPMPKRRPRPTATRTGSNWSRTPWLRDDGFVLFYQPMVGLQGAEGEHFEVLLRMNSPRSEIRPASSCLPPSRPA